MQYLVLVSLGPQKYSCAPVEIPPSVFGERYLFLQDLQTVFPFRGRLVAAWLGGGEGLYLSS